MKAIQVFCGSSTGFNPIYAQSAEQVGTILAQKEIQLVYGAGNVGLMGLMANAALAARGEVIGVIPHFLRDWEVCHEGLSQLVLTDTMHERKVKMLELSEAAIALPGGFGTLDEIFEVITLAQLTQSQQPIGFLNVNGFYDHLFAHCKYMVAEGFVKQAHFDMMQISDNIEDLLSKMGEAKPLKREKWVKGPEKNNIPI